MQVSLEWLSEFVNLPPLEELCSLLTMAGVEVEEVVDPTPFLDGVVVARIESCEPHPNADRLQVCTVSTGSEHFTLVCGAPNARAGLRVALAQVGTRLKGLKVGSRKVRGIASQGMICSQAELGIGPSDEGIWELPESYSLGMPIVEAAKIAPSLVLGITPNRPDLLSHIGIAREIAAVTGQRLKSVNWRLIEKGGEAGAAVRVVVDDAPACPRYLGRVIRNVTVQESPPWLQRRLEAIGQRPINNIVDATNYVLFEYGQPLHGFDLAKLESDAGKVVVCVRRPQEGETLETLDQENRKLLAHDLVIADANKPIALAGVIGGANSEVSEETVDVFLECAYFEPGTVRQTAKHHGLHTEASHRFERGTDPGIVGKALDRCAQLLDELGGGEVCKGVVEVSQKTEVNRDITLRIHQIPRLLGISLTPEEVVQLLEPLDIRCVGRNEDSLRFQAPSFRPDLFREVDLLEEVARRYGYDQIPEHLPSRSGPFVPEPKTAEPLSSTARKSLLSSGCSEVVTYAIGSPTTYSQYLKKEQLIRLVNPLGEELSALRSSLIPGLLSVCSRNIRQGVKHLRIFEIGRIFETRTPAAEEDPRDKDLPSEDVRVAFLLLGGRFGGGWYEGDAKVDFHDLSGTMESLIASMGCAMPLSRVPLAKEGWNPHACAELQIGPERIGFMGEIHPDIAQQYGLGESVFAAEISLSVLERLEKRSISFQPLPKYPGTRRDLAVIASKDLTSESVQRFLKENAGGALGKGVIENVQLFDIYKGNPIPAGHVSLGFAIFYRSKDRTLTDEEVGPAFEAVLEKVKLKFGVEIRS